MSFLRHEEIYRSDVRPGNTGSGNRCRRSQCLIGLDESPAGYSLAGCSPAEPASASPTANCIQPPTPPYNDFSSNGAYPLNLVSQPKGAVQQTSSTTPATTTEKHQGAGQDMKDAAHATGQAAKKTGSAVKTTTKKGAHAVAHETKKGANKVEGKSAPPPQ